MRNEKALLVILAYVIGFITAQILFSAHASIQLANDPRSYGATVYGSAPVGESSPSARGTYGAGEY